MKQKILTFSFIIFALFCSITKVYAISTANTGINVVNIRSLATTASSVVFSIPANKGLTIIEDTKITGNGCPTNWYKITYDVYEGYACSYYLFDINMDDSNSGNQEPDDDSTPDTPVNTEVIYNQELAKFPDSYKTKIQALHAIYPNAIFKYKKVNIAFNTFSTYQYQGYNAGSLSNCSVGKPKGISLIEDTNGSRDGLKALDSWAYTALTDTFNTNYSGGEPNRWFAPSLDTVKYYVDPRNFLINNTVFMFEQLSYSGDYYTEANVEKILSGTFMYQTKVSGKDNTTFAKTFLDAGIKYNVNPYFLASRVIQEIGTVRTTMASGTYPGYVGYYNFFNIGAYGTTKEQTIQRGLTYAKNQGWNNEYTAIVEGSRYIAEGYIAVGQDTNYFQRFDVDAPCYGYHQYMQNIEAPQSESIKIYNAYNRSGLLQSNFVFVIPVYDSMPASTSFPDTRNSNNYLRDLTVNGATVTGFNYTKNEYTINVSPLISSVDIAATKSSTKSSLSGTGKFNLTSTSQIKNIVVTAQNGTTRTYKITVTRDANIPITISEILNTMLVNSDGINISSIALNTKANDFVARAKTVDNSSNVVIKDKSGNTKTEQILATGDQVLIESGEDSKTFNVVIYGDSDGDGKITALDYVKIKNHIMSSNSLSSSYKEAADVDRDTKITALDYVKIKNHIMGKGSITQ